MRDRKLLLFLLITVVALLLVIGCAEAPEEVIPVEEEEAIPEEVVDEDKPEITIGLGPYTDAWPGAYISKLVAEELGYPTRFIEGDMGFMWLGVAQGDIDTYPDAWLPSTHASYAETYEGQFEIVGLHFTPCISGFTVPSYVDITDYEELKGRGDEFNNQVIGIEPAAGIMHQAEDILEYYDLADEYTLVDGSTAAMLGEVKAATESGDAIIFVAWRPHPMFQQFDIKMLENEISGIFDPDEAFVIANPGLKEKAPDFYDFLGNMLLTVEEVESLMLEIDEGADPEELHRQWIEDNRDRVDQMLGR